MMKKIIVVTTCLIMTLLCNINLFAQDLSGLKVTFVSNEAFVITLGSKKVLIDGLYTIVESPNVAPTTATIEKMKNAEPPFDNIDLICISHNHNDHFNRDCVGKHLENDKKAVLVCPNSVGNSLKNYSNYSLIKDRIIQISPMFNTLQNKEINGIPLTILGCRHSMTIFKNMDHEGFLIDLEGCKILHMGDSDGTYPDEFNAFQLQNDSIDIAFLAYDFFAEYQGGIIYQGLSRVTQYINPKNIVVMHCNPSEFNGGDQIVDAFKNDFPNFFLFKNEFEEKELINDTLVKVEMLKLSTDTISMGASVNSNTTFGIISNTDWTITCSETWLTLSKTAGSANSVITLTAEFNPTSVERTAKVTVSGNRVASQTIVVTQKSSITGIVNTENNTIQIFPNPTTGLFTITFGSNPRSEKNAEIYNQQGTQIFSKYFKNTASAMIDLTGFPKGIYLLKLSENGKIYSDKINLK